MADTKLTDLTAITTPASGDKLYIVDVSDTSDSSDGSSRQITFSNLVTGISSALTLTLSNISDVTASAAEVNVLDGIAATLTATELSYVDGVTSAIQTQLDAKAPLASPTFTGTVTLPVGLTGIAKLTSGVVSAVTAPTGTIVGTSDTQELSNKTHDGDFKLKNTTDNIQVNNADPKRGIYVPAIGMYPSTTAGCAAIAQVESATNKVNIKVLDFDGAGTSKEFAEFGIPSPMYWDASTITCQFVWYATAGSGTVNWEIQAGAFSDDDALDAAYGTLQEVTDTLLATGDVHISAATAAVTVAGTPVAGDWVNFRIARDPANDTNTSDARLMGVIIRFGRAKYDDQ